MAYQVNRAQNFAGLVLSAAIGITGLVVPEKDVHPLQANTLDHPATACSIPCQQHIARCNCKENIDRHKVQLLRATPLVGDPGVETSKQLNLEGCSPQTKGASNATHCWPLAQAIVPSSAAACCACQAGRKTR